MEPFHNPLSPLMGWGVKGQHIQSFATGCDLVQQFQVGAVVDAGEIQVNQQAVLQLAGFPFPTVAWIHPSLHSLDCGAFQQLIGLAFKLLKHRFDEVIVWELNHPVDQMGFAAARRPGDHDHVARVSLLLGKSHGQTSLHYSILPVDRRSVTTSTFGGDHWMRH